jgi:signal transduction histidine kinase
LEVNQAACEFLERPREGILGQPLASFTRDESTSRLRQLISDFVPGNCVQATIELSTPSEPTRMCRVAAIAVMTEDGQKQILWLLTDVTDMVNAEQRVRQLNGQLEQMVGDRTRQLERTLEQLRAAIDHKNEFLSLMSHELRTPLTVLLGGTRLLEARLDSISDADRKLILTDMAESGDRLQHLIENLMMLARLDPLQEAQLEPVLLQRIVRNAAAGFCAKNGACKVEVDLPQDLPLVLGHAGHLERVMGNLLANASKYGIANAPVRISSKASADSVEVWVHNQGTIEDEEAEHIFDPFFRSKHVNLQKPGAGIGLTVCQRLMEAQGGRIWLDPDRSKGVTFKLALPRSEAQEPMAHH